jgi:hypothetical protein
MSTDLSSCCPTVRSQLTPAKLSQLNFVFQQFYDPYIRPSNRLSFDVVSLWVRNTWLASGFFTILQRVYSQPRVSDCHVSHQVLRLSLTSASLAILTIHGPWLRNLLIIITLGLGSAGELR